MPTANPPKTHSAWLAYAAMLGFILLVSSSPAVTRLGVTRTLTPYDLMVMRCGIGALIFLPYFLTQLKKMQPRLLAIGFVPTK